MELPYLANSRLLESFKKFGLPEGFIPLSIEMKNGGGR
jgi:hypothetical protein